MMGMLIRITQGRSTTLLRSNCSGESPFTSHACLVLQPGSMESHGVGEGLASADLQVYETPCDIRGRPVMHDECSRQLDHA